LTGYNAVPAQTDSDPSTTASGSPSNPEVVAARSRDMADTLPFGTVIAISAPAKFDNNCGYSLVEPLIGYRVIADTMNVRFAKYVDVLFDTGDNYKLSDSSTKNASTILGVCNVTIRVIGHIDLAKGVPATQRALASLVTRQVLAPSLALK
jgi:3D (Asp-Asp-Asp) domain-containing protein